MHATICKIHSQFDQAEVSTLAATIEDELFEETRQLELPLQALHCLIIFPISMSLLEMVSLGPRFSHVGGVFPVLIGCFTR